MTRSRNASRYLGRLTVADLDRAAEIIDNDIATDLLLRTTDTRVGIKILRHPTTKLVGLSTRAQVDGDLAAWINPVTQQPELLPAGTWQHNRTLRSI